MAVTGGATLRMIVYDLLRDLKQVYAEATITPYQAAYWVLVHADRLKKLHIEKRDSGAFVTVYDVDVAVDPDNGRNYFVLPINIYDIHLDRGIAYISYPPGIDLDLPAFAGTVFTRTNVEKIRRLYYREDERPSPANPYFYRIQDRIYLLGVEQIDLLTAEVGLNATFDPASTSLTLDQTLDFPQDLIPTLKRQILDMGRFVMMVPRDMSNDGASIKSPGMPADKIVSVQEHAMFNNPDNI